MDFPRPFAYLLRCQKRRTAFWAAPLLLLHAVGCSDGTVTANGHVMIEGKPASGGRLSLTPVEGGPQAFSLVTEEGEFALRIGGDALGAPPGPYHVFFDLPLDAPARKRYARELAGQLDANELSFAFRGPQDKPLAIPAAGVADLKIDIRQDQGWTSSLND